MAFKAFVFDFDGIITDTEPVHMEAWLGALEPLGLTIEEDEFKTHYVGLNDRDFLDAVGKMHGHHFSDSDKASYIEQKTVATIELLKKNVPLMPGVEEFIDEIRKDGIMAICSGANRGEIDYILKKLKWFGYFDPIVASDSVKKGKPDPEGYIRAYEGLMERSDSPLMVDDVVAIEDSPKGIEAAKAAGLRCLAVSNTFDWEELTKADWVVQSLAEVDLDDLTT